VTAYKTLNFKNHAIIATELVKFLAKMPVQFNAEHHDDEYDPGYGIVETTSDEEEGIPQMRKKDYF
jgi:hypothetical protein